VCPSTNQPSAETTCISYGDLFVMTYRTKLWAPVLLVVALVVWPVASQSTTPASTSVSPDKLIQFLNQSITLYHQTTIQLQTATEPQEQLLLYDNKQLANQSVQLAFDFARAQVEAMSSETASSQKSNAASTGSTQYDSMRNMLATLDKQLQDTEAESASDTAQLAHATGAKHTELESQISELQGEIALAHARRDAVRSLLEFASGSANKTVSASDLRAEIDALAASIPSVSSGSITSGQSRSNPEPVALTAGQPTPSGIWDLTANLFTLSSKIRTVNAMLAETSSLLQTAQDLRAPFVAQLRSLSSQGDQLANLADTSNPAQLAQEKQQLDSLAAQFRAISADVIPLSKQNVLLGLYQKNLSSWRDDIYTQYKADLRNLGLRLGGLVLLFAVIFGLSELWRRGVYRYVREARRRYQFLLLRKFAFWFVIGLIIIIILAPKLGSFVTFAGLLTAGIAVALQNVIVAVVGYFFLIGKFGIRVGDRVEASGITGEVIDIGLVRFHLMELGAGNTPTGRVVAFSNSIVFQANAGLFKQIPGASFAWHQVTLTVPREADFGLIKKSLVGAVENVLRDYEKDIQHAYGEMEKTGILMSKRDLRPMLELHLTTSGIEATIRYPVDFQHASDIDARVSRELLDTLARDSKLQAPTGPSIQVKAEVPAPTK
jgi:small-conductance mechanosensitive channel